MSLDSPTLTPANLPPQPENPVAAIIARRHHGENLGVYSVCSAHPLVLRAAVRQAVADDSVLLVEATSNQVDQYGGYTGMTPEQFRTFITDIATSEGLPVERLILGGDHLGPNRWQRETAEEALPKAEAVVAAYAYAGYTKLHIDCSMPLKGDPVPLPDEIVAERAARLIAVAESHLPSSAGSSTPAPIYVIGTEVPVPGGAHETLGVLHPTELEAARATLAAHRETLARHGLERVWPRVSALVVQPGVEFDHQAVIDYQSAGTLRLRTVLTDAPGMVFEAHSTDYQTRDGLGQLVHDGWAILKVGPGLTFALREALFALAAIETELIPERERSDLRELMERHMLARPAYWEGYYEGSPAEQHLARVYSYSDRIRYYWADREVEQTQARLFDNLREHGIPEPLLSQYLPRQFALVREGLLTNDPEELVIQAVRFVLTDYAAACGLSH